MDRMIYLAMTGAKYTLEQQAAVANNLANADTPGFKEAMHRLRAVNVHSQALPSRAFVVDATVSARLSDGALELTGRPLDVAIAGRGWFAVQTPDGGEAYTRNGAFQVDSGGVLRLPSGQAVLGEGGAPITLPPDREYLIGNDGTVNAIDPATRQVEAVGRLRLVDPPLAELQRGDDGLFRLPQGTPQPAEAAGVQVRGGYLEKSNVDVVDQMVRMIALARQFEMNTKAIKVAEEDDQRATALLTPR